MSQAQFLEPFVFAGVDFSVSHHILEVGCGVGAQSKLLLEKFPNLKIESIDVSDLQLAVARIFHQAETVAGRIHFSKMHAESMTFANDAFDGAFICWVLEHVQDPMPILKEVKRCLQPGGQVVCMEVQNSTLFLHPKSPAVMEFWGALNAKQIETGNPFVGAILPGLMKSAGFDHIRVNFPVQHMDQRNPIQLGAMLDYWLRLLLSGADVLLADGRVSQKVVDRLSEEIAIIKKSDAGVFLYTPVQVFATKPMA